MGECVIKNSGGDFSSEVLPVWKKWREERMKRLRLRLIAHRVRRCVCEFVCACAPVSFQSRSRFSQRETTRTC